jgi:hypothetical protein
MKRLLALVLLAFAACYATSASRLDTTWKGEAHPGVMSTLAFGLDGKARWTFELPGGPQVYELEYELSDNPDRTPRGALFPPMFLDFRGFESGPFAGKTLYGIAHWDAETLVYEAVPGDPESGGDAVRPKDFTGEARRFTRVN